MEVKNIYKYTINMEKIFHIEKIKSTVLSVTLAYLYDAIMLLDSSGFLSTESKCKVIIRNAFQTLRKPIFANIDHSVATNFSYGFIHEDEYEKISLDTIKHKFLLETIALNNLINKKAQIMINSF